MKRMIFKVWTCLMVSAACSACGSQPAQRSAKGVEQSSAIAPDGERKAFVWLPESSGYLGATVSTFYQVWIQDLHHTRAEQLLLNADKTEGFRLIWTGPRGLQICFVTARISQFRNFFVVATQEMPEVHHIEINLKKVPSFDDCAAASQSGPPAR
jgi:hypothetical protein